VIAAAACAVALGVLPSWATAGFTDPHPALPHVVGDHGRIAALVFGYPLQSQPRGNRANKILWVARRTPTALGPLRIRARLGSRVVTRTVADGPGPSIVDLPARGCWQVTLTWPGGSDTMRLRYG
jgi:hypothetical protein